MGTLTKYGPVVGLGIFVLFLIIAGVMTIEGGWEIIKCQLNELCEVVLSTKIVEIE
jgi:hypothetical protein